MSPFALKHPTGGSRNDEFIGCFWVQIPFLRQIGLWGVWMWTSACALKTFRSWAPRFGEFTTPRAGFLLTPRFVAVKATRDLRASHFSPFHALRLFKRVIALFWRLGLKRQLCLLGLFFLQTKGCFPPYDTFLSIAFLGTSFLFQLILDSSKHVPKGQGLFHWPQAMWWVQDSFEPQP